MTPEQIQQLQTDALQWEVNNRTSLNRAVLANGACVYTHNINGGCAVGRLLPQALASKLSAAICDIDQQRLPEHVRHMGLMFLMKLQHLHDTMKNWDDAGLSLHGLGMARSLMNEYNLTIDFSKYGSQQ